MGTGNRAYLVVCVLGILAAITALASVAASQPSAPLLPKLPADLEKVRAALQKYEDPIVAVHDGYFSTIACVEVRNAGGPGTVPSFAVGGMGIHFLNPALLGPEVDPLRPQILLYEPTGGKLRLIAAEWFVPLATGVKTRPALFGAPFDGPMEGHHPVMPTDLHHYDLHVWLWKENPAGLFKPINPSMTCGDYSYTVKDDAPRIVPHR
jgi:hypothetical protein